LFNLVYPAKSLKVSFLSEGKHYFVKHCVRVKMNASVPTEVRGRKDRDLYERKSFKQVFILGID
jgi:hypothetical protein